MSSIKSFSPKDLDPRSTSRFLLGGVAPRPIAFASTVDKDGRVNLAPFSYFNVFSKPSNTNLLSGEKRKG